uniref:Secreted protein n=1 Tax=Romanomermis culicivorax TaxID=13658 RepID=A0A915KP16_ROMCU
MTARNALHATVAHMITKVVVSTCGFTVAERIDSNDCTTTYIDDYEIMNDVNSTANDKKCKLYEPHVSIAQISVKVCKHSAENS